MFPVMCCVYGCCVSPGCLRRSLQTCPVRCLEAGMILLSQNDSVILYISSFLNAPPDRPPSMSVTHIEARLWQRYRTLNGEWMLPFPQGTLVMMVLYRHTLISEFKGLLCTNKHTDMRCCARTLVSNRLVLNIQIFHNKSSIHPIFPVRLAVAFCEGKSL